MAVTLKYRILELLSRDHEGLYSISDVAKSLGVAYSHAHGAVRKLVSDEVIRINKVGNVSVCKINLKSQMTVSMLAINSARKTTEWMKKNPQAAKITEKINIASDNVHCVLVKGNKVILVVPEKIKGADFSMFRNRTVITSRQLVKKRKYYSDAIVLHGAEKYWSFMSDKEK